MRKTNLTVLTLILLALLFCLPTAAVTRRGDLDGDGSFSVSDALSALRCCLGGDYNAQCDMNGDGEVTLVDVLCILRYAAAGSNFTQNALLCTPTKTTGIYNYCPSVLEEADGTRYLYYCTNQNSYEIIDYIGCRRGTPNADGSYTYGAETIVLEPTAGKWDAHHTCDPSVVKGNFTYKGQSYSYLMAYLGCTSYDNQNNEIGFAVANDPMGPFVKIADTPTIPYVREGDAWQWGVGQASLVSKDKSSTVYVFYTEGTATRTHEFVDEWNFADLENPVRLSHTDLAATGLKTRTGGGDYIGNADFAYDAGSNSFYMATDSHPYPSDEPNYITEYFRVAYFAGDDMTRVRWNELEHIGPAETGFARNHNVALVRDAYGWLPGGHSLTVYYTGADKGSNALWTYRLHAYTLLK